MNGIILYGSRYGAARQYAQALEERTGLPAVSYAEVRDFGPFDTIVYVFHHLMLLIQLSQLYK